MLNSLRTKILSILFLSFIFLYSPNIAHAVCGVSACGDCLSEGTCDAIGSSCYWDGSACNEVWWTRTDGGSRTTCNGRYNAPASAAPNCAYDNPMVVNGHYTDAPNGGTAGKMTSGDYHVIASGEYKIGYGATAGLNCSTSFPYGCWMRPPPDNTFTFGCAAGDGCASLAQRPILWGDGTIDYVFNLKGTDGVWLQDVDITDHSSTGLGHPTLSGTRNVVGNGQAERGLNVSGASNLTTVRVSIHGMYQNGIYGTVNGWTAIDTNSSYNAWDGWDTDDGGNNQGTIAWSGTSPVTSSANPNGCSLSWGGCIEDWQNPYTVVANGCYTQGCTGGGNNADGFSSSASDGDISFYQCDLSFNTHDGGDFLYWNKGSRAGGTVSMKKSRMEGNLGNGFKSVLGFSTLEDNIILANCNFHKEAGLLAPQCNSNCRAGGTAVAFAQRDSQTGDTNIKNNTILAGGRGMFIMDGLEAQTNFSESDCPSGTNLNVEGNLLIGGKQAPFPSNDIYLWYNDIEEKIAGHCRVELVLKDNVCIGNMSPTDCTDTIAVTSQPARYQTAVSGNVYTATYSNAVTGTIKQSSGNWYTTTDYMDQVDIVNNTSYAYQRADCASAGTDITDFVGFDRDDADANCDSSALEYGGAAPSDVCGDSVIGVTEQCDDGGTVPSDGCSATCQIESGYSCTGEPSVCAANCGDGTIINPPETCDDSDTTGGDGCSANCQVESGWTCVGEPSVCTQNNLCGDGTKSAQEQCDDGGTVNGDGCSAICENENVNWQLFLLGTESDASNRMDVHTHTNIVSGLGRNETASLKFDMGVNAIGDFTYDYYYNQSNAIDAGSATPTLGTSSAEHAQSATSTNTFSLTVNSQPNQIAACFITREEFGTNRTISSVIRDGQSFTAAAATSQTASGNNKVDAYYLLNPNTGTSNVVVTYSGSVGSTAAVCDTFYGIAQQAPETVSSSANTSTNYTVQSDGSIVIGGLVAAISTATLTADGSETHNFANPGEHKMVTNYEIIPTAGSESTTWGVSSGDYATMVMVFAPANTGGAQAGTVGIFSSASASYADITAQDTGDEGFYLLAEGKSSAAETLFRLVNLNGTNTEDTFIINDFQPEYWGRISRSGTTLSNSFYSDQTRTTLVDTQTVVTTTALQRYIDWGISKNDAVTGTSISATIGNVDLTAGAQAGGASTSYTINGQTSIGSFP